MSAVEEKEVMFDEHDLITSMTNPKGMITYVNDVFCKIAGYSREELIGKPHNIVRHDDMPRVVFKLLWDTVLSGKPIAAFVKNRTKSGDYYWVKAYVAPIIVDGKIERITSYRRPISGFVKTEITKLYKQLLEYEATHTLDETFAFFVAFLKARNLSYEQFVDRLSMDHAIGSAEAMSIDIDRYYIDHVAFKSQIIQSVKQGKKEIEVTEACCCPFGKALSSMENMPFTSHASWGKVHRYHNHVHTLMQEYVDRAAAGAAAEELNQLTSKANEDMTALFAALSDVIDNYVE